MRKESLSLNELNRLPKDGFVKALSGIYEHSPWVPEGVYERRPFATDADLHGAMVQVVAGSGPDRQLALIRAHPDLAGKAARVGALSEASTGEQAAAGLNRLSEQEYARFHDLNDAYKRRFSFPFILAVKGHSPATVLAAFERRLQNDSETERETALEEIYKIARFRLDAFLKEGR